MDQPAFRKTWEPGTTISAIVIFYEKEIPLLRLLARSMRLFLDAALFSKIVFLNNSVVPETGRHLFEREVLPELGQLKDRAVCLDAADLGVTVETPQDGYAAQQALKMEVSRQIEDPFYLVFDAKNHLTRKLTAELLFAPDGRPRSHWSPYGGYLLTCLRHSYAFWGLALPAEDKAYPTVTPSLLLTDVVRAMLSEIRETSGSGLCDVIRANDKRTEFLLYSGYLDKVSQVGTLYDMGKPNYATLFTKWPQTPEDIRRVIGSLHNPEVYAFGVHSRRFAQLSPESSRMIAGVWHDAGLFDSIEEGIGFIRENALAFPLPSDAREAESAIAQDVLIGRNRQLFILNGTNQVMDQHRGKVLLSRADVVRWRRVLETRVAVSRAHDADYAMLIAPDTHSVFRDQIAEFDHAPDMRPVVQLQAGLGENRHVHYPLAALIRGRSEGIVCHTADSHWSGFGAYVAYRSFLSSLPFPLEMLPPEAVESFDKEGPGDLGDKLTPPLPGRYTECVVRKPASCKIWDNGVNNRGYMACWRSKRTDLPKGVLFMDSYGWKLQRFLAESFSELFIVHSPYYEWDVIETYKPDVVISEMAERFLIRVPGDLVDEPALETAKKKSPEARYPSRAELEAIRP